MDALGDVLEQGLCDFVVRGVLLEVDGDEDLFGFGVDIADVDAALVGEEDPVAL